jgi:hypothetical protein
MGQTVTEVHRHFQHILELREVSKLRAKVKRV